MNEFIVKNGKRLKLGYTTGSCAAAAAKAACEMLLSSRRKERISIMTPKGIELNLDVQDIRMGAKSVSCAIEKDSGDDPDVTKGSHIVATVSFAAKSGISIDGGSGVGRVTKPGLDQPVGEAAINSVPRQMILENVEEVCRLFDYKEGLKVVISVPRGGELARRTFNPRLGIEGGISILGSTGIVEPMSEKALVDTIRVELRQRRELGADYALLTPGNYGSEFVHLGLELNSDIAVQSSNFIGDAIDICKDLTFRGALLVGHIGKLVKIAGGMLNTHSKYGDCRMEILAAHAAACGFPAGRVEELLNCVSSDDAVRILDEENMRKEVLGRVIERIHFHLSLRAEPMESGAVIFSKKYGFLAQTPNAPKLLRKIRKV